EAFDENAASPLTGGLQMTAIDGSSPFSQGIGCLATESFVHVFFAVGSGGDVSPLTVSQDTDFDGSYDVTQTLPFPVSGVCANGVIACSPGTWTGCQGYRWATLSQANHQIALIPSPFTDLQACTCVNNSCGSGLAASNQAQIGQTIASGIANALQTVDARYAISSVGQTPFEVTLSGQNSTDCHAPGPLTQTAYYDNPALMTTDGAAAASADPLYTTVTSLDQAAGFVTTYPNCSIERQLVASERIHEIVQIVGTGDVTVTVISDNELILELGSPIDVVTLNESCSVGHLFTADILVTDPASLESIVVEEFQGEDHSQLHVDGTFVYAFPADFTNYSGPATGSCNHSADWYDSPGLDLTSYFTDGLNHSLRARTVVGNQGHSYFRIRIRTRCRSEIQMVNSCGAIAANPDCRLFTENADGVGTYAEGVSTGLSPIPSVLTAGLGVCEVTVEQDWWLKARTYQCTADHAGGYIANPPNLDRMTYIYDHTSPGGYQDQIVSGDGSTATLSGTFDISAFETSGDCDLSCKVSRPRTVDGITLSGLQASSRTSTASTETVYKSCGASGQCPLLAGETLRADCGCLDEFPEALVAMQAVRMGGFDQMCTTGAQAPW
ncbi:MAG: hypothetical protein AAGG79_02435, partial [Pseudomonadota bacterium]